MTLKTLLLAALIAPLTACGIFDERVDPAFGQSVRHMVRAQTYNPGAESMAPQAPALDGAKAAIAVRQYRTDKSEGTSAPPVNISIGE